MPPLAPRQWLPHAGFVALVVAIVAFGVATRGDSAARSDTTAHVSRQDLPPAELPEGTVLRLWRLVQLGGYPLVLPLYDRRVTDALGIDRIIGTLSLQREMALSQRPVVKSVERTRLGNLVSVETSGESKPLLYSFIVRQRHGRWLIIYDTLLGDALPLNVQNEVRERSSSASEAVTRRAGAAGQAAVARFRRLFITENGAKASGRRKSPPQASGGGPPASAPPPPTATQTTTTQTTTTDR